MTATFPPYCGAEFGAAVAGAPVVCDRELHSLAERHKHTETGFSWWGFQSYPRTPWVPPKESYMFGYLSALCFGVSFILYAAKAGTHVPWTPSGFVILGLTALALHLVWEVYPWRRRP